MAQQAHPNEPIRHVDHDANDTTLARRPEPDFQPDALHKLLAGFSIGVAITAPIFFALQSIGTLDVLPVRYGMDGHVLREGSVWEALGGLILLGLGTLALVILARYPKIMNYPVTLTEHNVQGQYKTAVYTLVWVAFSMSLTMLILVASWLQLINIGWIWLALLLTVTAIIIGISRMLKLR